MPTQRDLTEFNLLYAQASDLAKGFPEAQFKTIAALFVVVGWLLTASTAQAFIRSHAALLLPATVFAFSLLALFKALWIYAYCKKSEALYARLSTLARAEGLSVDTVEVFRVGRLVPLTFFAINVVVCASVIVIVWLVCA